MQLGIKLGCFWILYFLLLCGWEGGERDAPDLSLGGWFAIMQSCSLTFTSFGCFGRFGASAALVSGVERAGGCAQGIQ